MANLIDLKTFTDERGNLTVIEKTILFDIKRIFYIYGVENSARGGHRHKTLKQAAICLRGSCHIYNNDGQKETQFILDKPNKCLILESRDWHSIDNFSADAIVMILASDFFDPNDYIVKPY